MNLEEILGKLHMAEDDTRCLGAISDIAEHEKIWREIRETRRECAQALNEMKDHPWFSFVVQAIRDHYSLAIMDTEKASRLDGGRES